MSVASSPEYRLRVEYAKQGRGAYLSHLEVIRALERIVRRADLPYASTQGFSPHMKIAFGPALGVGTASLSEQFDVTLSDYLDADEAMECLRAAAPQVLPIIRCGYVSPKEPSLSASVNILKYQVIIDGDVAVKTESPPSIEVQQKGKTKTYDALVSLPEGVSVMHTPGVAILNFTVRATPQGTLRPDSLVAYLVGQDAEADLTVSVLRTATLIEEGDGTWRDPLAR